MKIAKLKKERTTTTHEAMKSNENRSIQLISSRDKRLMEGC